MPETFNNIAGTSVIAETNDFTVFTAPNATRVRHWSGHLAWEPGKVYVDDPSEDEPSEFNPDEARVLAAALLRAADEAEGRTPGDAESELLTFMSQAGWDGTAMVSALVDEVRGTVASELESLPTYNDVADWCAHIGRQQAIDTARNGRSDR